MKAYIDHYVDKTEYVHGECFDFNINFDHNINQTHVTENSFDQSLANIINIMDRYDFFCRSINFARYFLRFMSAYIIVAFTIQRTQAIRKPFLQRNFESGKKVFFVLIGIGLSATLSSMWIPILLKSIHLESSVNQTQCYIRDGYNDIYFALTNGYIFVIMLIPMVIICVCNSITIYTLRTSNSRRKLLTSICINSHLLASRTVKTYKKYFSLRLETLHRTEETNQPSHFESEKTHIFRMSKGRHQEHKTNIVLLIMSLSYNVLEFPYFVSWICLFYHDQYMKADIDEDVSTSINNSINKNFLLGIINLTELFYLSNFSIHFYIYCITSNTFCKYFRPIFK